MTIFNEGRHAIRALVAAVAATAGRAKNCFAQGLTRSEGASLTIMPDRRIAGSPDRRIAGSPDRRIAGSPDRRIAGSPDRRIAGSPDRRIAGSPDRRIAPPASSARDCSRPLASPPESSDSFDPSPARAAAGSRPAARRLRRGLFSALLCLPLLLGLAAPAAAQTISGETRIDSHSVSEDGNTFTVDWSYFVRTVGWIDGGTSAGLWEYHVRENGGAHTATEIGQSATSVITFTLSSSASGRLVEVRIRHKSTSTNSAWTTVQDNRVADTTAPSVTSIERQTPSSSPTNADSVKWRVTFNEAVQNVDAGDFQVSGTALTITVVSPVTGSETTTYDVTVSSGDLAGLDGTVTLSFASGHNIQDMAGNALAASPVLTGTDNSYVVDNTAPGVTSITRQTPANSPTGADSLIWRVTFDEAVQHVNTADFQVSGTTATITAVSPVTGSETTTYDVTATGGNLAGLNGTVTLSFASSHNIEDEAGNSLATSPTVSGTNHNTFMVSNTAPTTPTLSLSLASTSGNEGNSGNSDVDVTLTLSPTRSASTAFDFCVKNTGTAIFRTASGSNAKDFDIVHFSGGSQLSMNAQNCHRYTIGGNSGSSQVKLRIFGDTTPELNETAILELRNPESGVAVSSSAGSVTYTILNDDGTLTEPMVTITGGHEVREGRGAAFTLTASPAPTWDLPVDVTVTQSGDFVADDDLGMKMVTIPSGQTLHTFTVATVNDGGRTTGGTTPGQESDGSVTVTVDSGDGYTVGSSPSATVSILDDDTNAGSGNFINVWGRGPATLNEDSRGSRHFMVKRWGHDSDGNSPTGNWGFKLCFTGTATPGVDYTLDTHFAEERGIAIGADGCTAQRTIPGSSDRYHFYISHVDDPHAEGDETIVVTATSLVNVHLHQQPYTDTDRFTIVDDDTPAPDEPDQQAERAEFETAEAQAPSCVSDALLADAQLATTETWRTSPGHVERWSRVLAAFGVDNAYSNNPMTVAEAQAQADRGLQRWKPVAPALECLAAAPEEQAEQAEAQPATPATPELSLRAGSAVDEGGNATFTVTADPAPATDLTITWTVAQSGEYLAAPGAGSRTVTLTAGTTSTDLSVGTVDDAADEADGSVSVTLGAGTGYTIATGKGSAAVAVRDNDATPATPELSLSAGFAVDEGGHATFTVTADPAPQSDLTIAWTVAQSGDYLAAPGAGSRTVTLAAGATSTALSVATVDDAADEADGSVSVTLGTGTGYTVATGKGSAAVAVRDNDEPVVSIAAGNGVTEGAAVSFTVSTSPVPAAPLDVTLTVAQSGDFAASGETGSRTVTVPVTGSATFEVATVDDGADEPDGSVTATVDAGTGYTVAAAPDNAATVAVSDNDAAASGPTLSIADATFNENADRVHFTVTLSEPVDRTVTVRFATRDSTPVSARADQDYLAWKRAWQVWARFRPGETETRIFTYIYNDSHDEDPETFEMVLFDASDGVSIADGVAVGTIVNDDPMPAAWLARFGRAVAEHALRDIADRIAAPRMAGVEGVLAGQALGGPTGAGSPAFAAPDRFNSPVDRRFDAGFGNSGPAGQVMSLRDFMLSSSFTATGAVDMTGGSMAFWGRASEGSFAGREGRVSLSGDTMTALLGADYARGPWLLGMALAESEGRSSYADTGTSDAAAFVVPAGVPGGLDALSVQAGSGEVEGRLTAVIPYLALEASEHVRLWSAMGQGSGTVTVTPALGGRHEAATSWTMMAAGLRGDLLAPGGHTGPALALTSDALWVRTSSEKTRDLAASESDVSRLRLGLEGSWAAALGGDASLTPKLELGARHDGGDAETGFGVEVGTGLAWVDPKLGLTFDVSARTLLTHDAEGREDRGVAAQLAFDPDGASARGLSLGLTQDWGGQAAGGLDALFSDAPLEDRTGSSMAESRWVAEAAYGLPVFGGRFTGSPHMGLGLATGARDYTLGWRLTPAAGGPAVSFGVQATRRESDGTVPEHTVGFEINARW